MNTNILAEQILTAWSEADRRQHVSDYPCGVPDKEDIEALLHVAFYGSIQREESQFITFNLMLLQTHKQTQPRHQLTEFNRFIELSEPIALTVESIRKLSGANDERTSSLIIEKRGGHLVITGIAPFGRNGSRLNSASTGGYPRPEALTISVRAPGSLLISRASGNLGRFVAGNFENAQVSPFQSQSLGADIIAKISTHTIFSSIGNSYWHWYRDTIEHLLRSAAGRGHGGTIIWVPHEHATMALEQTRLGNRLVESNAIYDAFIEVVRKSDEADKLCGRVFREPDTTTIETASEALALSMYIPNLKVQATTLLNALAQIACVDGATIIDDHFKPLIFGARLGASEWTGPIQLGPVPLSNTGGDVTRSRFGTRHNSAIDFVGAISGAIAFVISQDGPVRGITRRGDTVFLWPDCLNTMFID